MTNYREILRLYSLGLNKTQIAEICGYSRNTVAQTIKQAEANGLKYPLPDGMSDTKLAAIIRPNAPLKVAYKMPDYAYVVREMLKCNVTLNLLWLEYAEECKKNGEIPYQLTQFKKYYRDYMAKTGATMHLDHKPFQKKDGSRAALFQEEKPFLMPLHPYELSTWKIATVAPNYHISIDKINYSVPFEYIKKKVDVRLTKNTVEVFFDGNRICSHRRLYGRANQYSTNEEHMPPNHQKYVQWNGDRFIKRAAKIGSSTKTVVAAVLNSYKVEQQGYKACIGILRLADKYTPERLENACKKVLTFTLRPSYKNIQVILSSGQDKPEKSRQTEVSSADAYGFTRGADYYGGED